MKTMRRILGIALAVMLLLPAALAAGTGTVYTGSDGKAQLANIDLALSMLGEVTVAPGGSFSFNDSVGPRSKARGFKSALNGRGAKVVGGGVAQVAAAIRLSVKDLPEVEITEVSFYGSRYTGDYVDRGSDAVLVDYGKTDFAFRNTGKQTLTLTLSRKGDELKCKASFSGEDGLIASATISLEGTNALKKNIALAAEAVDGTLLTKGETFSFNDTVGPRTKDRGYRSALNGRGAKVVGGGVAQVASVIWLCVKETDLISVTEKSTYGKKYNQSYVSSASDAILTDYSSGTDFCFRNRGKTTLRLEVTSDGETLTCELYEENGSSGGILIW